MKLDHKHLILNADVNKPPVEPKAVEDFLRKLTDTIGMKVKIGPIAAYCEAEGNHGVTGAVCIETSHISIHAWDKVAKPYLRLDVYSCAAFDPWKVVTEVRESFDATYVEFVTVGRNNNVDKHGERSTIEIGEVTKVKY